VTYLSSTLSRRGLLAGLALVPAGQALAQTAAPALQGEWFGALDLGARRLRLQLVIPVTGGAPLLYSLDQTGGAILGEATSLSPDRVSLRFPQINASLTGRLEGGQIDALFVQGGPVPLILARAGAANVWPALTTARLEAWRKAGELPALAAIATRRGGAVTQWQTGERAAGSGIPVEPGDLWHLGSNTKSMTATLAARLVEQGLIGWDDTVAAHLSAIAPQMRDGYRDVTFRHLFSHRSGLPANIAQEDLLKFGQTSPDIMADRRAYAVQALPMEPKGPKETTYEYSNAGYIVAAAMIETKLKTPWEDLIRTHLFEPLKIASAGFGPPGDGDPKRQPVRHLNRVPNPPGVVPDSPAVLGPAGRVHMSLADLSLYLDAHRDRASLLKAQTWDRLHTPPFGGDYAFGWQVRPDGTVWHNGSNNQWYAAMQFNAAKGISAAAACNDALGQGMVPAVLSSAASAV
jgi:CubicO group peptidase (beta-lactamase class C family)